MPTCKNGAIIRLVSTMTRYLQILTHCVFGALLAGCAGNFDPDLSMEEGSSTTTEEGSTGETAGSTGTAPDMGTDMGQCGDGVLDPGEECDAWNLGGLSCKDQGFGGGELACTADCQFDLTGCDSCVGDPEGMYGAPDEGAPCEKGFGGTIDGGATKWQVCIHECETHEDCFDPDLAMCDRQPYCQEHPDPAYPGTCKLTCLEDDDCPTGMFCVMSVDPFVCAWAV